VPAGQAAQALVALAKVPAGQVVAVKAQAAAPAGLKAAAAQARQLAAPVCAVSAVKRPAGQRAHAVCPCAL
jgi:hypothetical protein